MKPPKPIPPISDRQKQRNKEWAKVKRAFLKELRQDGHDTCLAALWGENKLRKITEVHHKFGELGPLRFWKPGLIGVSRQGHMLIHAKPDWARTRGLLAQRGEWNNTKLCTTENPATNTQTKVKTKWQNDPRSHRQGRRPHG